MCVKGDEQFDKIFIAVNEDIVKIRKEKTGGSMDDPLLVEMYRYQAENLPKRLEDLKTNDDNESYSIGDPLLWQVSAALYVLIYTIEPLN